MKLKSII